MKNKNHNQTSINKAEDKLDHWEAQETSIEKMKGPARLTHTHTHTEKEILGSIFWIADI